MNGCHTLTDKAYLRLIRPFFFRQDPEEIHELTLNWLEKAEHFGSLHLYKLLYPPVPDLHRLKWSASVWNFLTLLGSQLV